MFSKKEQYGFMDIGFTADVHSHILPGVDDGSPSIEESAAIISLMREAGVNCFTFTPHVSCGLFPNSSEKLKARFEELLAALPAELRDGATFQLAAEYMIDESFDDMLASARNGASGNRPLTFPDGSILIEMSYQSRSPQLLETVFDLVQDGYKPILAHPERYCFYFADGRDKYTPSVGNGSLFRKLGDKIGLDVPNPVKELPELEKLISMGCRLQLNIQSLTGCYGPASLDNLKYLLDHNFYSFIATDIHSAHQFSRFDGFTLTTTRLSKLRALAENNLRLF